MAANAERPNVLLILVDDMGYGDFGVFNDGTTETPALDGLTEEGICLTQHYSGSAVCAPARAALITGRYPHRTGAIDTLEGRGLDRLALREVTLGDAFGTSGYATGHIGKWHLGALDERYHPNNRGFDEFVGFRGGWSDYYEWRLDYNGEKREADGRYLTDVFTDEALGFIRRHRDEPFFLHLNYNAPHFPFQAPEEEIKPFRSRGEFTEAVSTIYGMIRRMDKGVGAIMSELEKLGLDENTIVIFTSDNGPQFGGEGEESTDRFNCDFRGAKGFVYEGGIRVPAIIRWPGELAEGEKVDRMVHFVDWFPTLVSACGLEVPQGPPIDGKDVLSTLQGESEQVESNRFWQWNRYEPLITCNAAVRDGEWKLVRPRIEEAMQVSERDLQMDRELKYEPEKHDSIRGRPFPDREVPPPPPPRLFNIEEDPLEETELGDRHPEKREELLKELEEWFAAVEADRARIED